MQSGEDEHREAERGDARPVTRTRDVREEEDQQRRRGGVKAAEHQVVAVADPVRGIEEHLRHGLPHRPEHRP